MGTNWRGALVYVFIFLAAVVLIFGLVPMNGDVEEMPLSQLVTAINAGRVETITVEENELEVTLTDGEVVATRKESDTELTEALLRLGAGDAELAAVDIQVQPPSPWGDWLVALGSFLPFIFLAVLFLFLMRQAQGTNNQALSFGKSRARMFTGEKPTVTFDDVAGVEEAKQELAEVVEFLKEPQKFISLGARIPKGVVLMGPPGTGKTLLAKAVSGEAGVPFFSISGSEFVEMFVGVGAARVRDLFDQARRNSPCIIFVDEVDAVGRHRGAGLGGSHDEREQTLNQILVEMDGFSTDTNIIVVAATNRPDILDPALLRPGRFDRRVVLDRPDIKGRKGILEVHARGKPLARDVDLDVLAQGTPGFVGADIENMVNEAAILAARRNKKAIGMSEFQEAIERVVAGPERKSRLITAGEKKVLAYHEAGHALVQTKLPNADPVHKVSIVARGMSLGYTMSMPEKDRYLYTQDKFEDDIAGMLAGRAAEELVFGDKWTGAGDDLEKATKLARKMVTAYGMSPQLGPLTFGDRDELVFLGREIAEQRNYSDHVAEEIDEEVRRIVEHAYERARGVLVTYRDKLDQLARRLIEVETLERRDFEALVAA
ncbi:MAG TPA: ATP-dependent zinc metalloprotease FtsH [Anaerolineae bacterium]|nr:ATP-dependent zinc metalloprotease FtsH [Anaerolineae bacterium]